MIASFIVAAVIGQYGGFAAGHCAHLATGYCAACAPHYAGYHAPAVFAADPNYYAGVVAAAIRKQAADEAAARAARDNAAKLDARLARIEAALSRPVAAPAPPPASTPAPVQPAAPPPDPESAANPLAAALERCAGCHSDSSPAGKLALFNDDGELKTLDLWTRVKVHERIKPDAPKRMPPKGEPLTDAERGVIADSIKSDLAAIAATLKD